MIPKSRRLKGVDLKDFKKDNILYGNLFVLNVYKLNNNYPSKFAVTISKKINPSAVLRNKIRRRTYAVIEKNLKKIINGYLFVFYPNKKTNNSEFDDCLKDIFKLLNTKYIKK